MTLALSFFTIARATALPHARVLADRIAHHHDARLTVLRLAPSAVDDGDEPFDSLWPADLDVPGWEDLLRDSRWEDLEEFFKPHMLSRLVGEGAQGAVYLNAAVDLRAPLHPLEQALERYGVVVAPRLLGELPVDGHRPHSRDLRRAGRYGGSLIALARRNVAVELVAWWAERLTAAALTLPSRFAGGGFASRRLNRWIDLAPSLFTEVGALRDRGSAVSYWNLHERRLEREGDGITADGRELRFAHFEGFDPTRPFLLNPAQDRVRTSESPALTELCDSYAAALIGAGWRDRRRRTDVGRRLPSGVPFDDRLSHLLAEAADAGEEPDVFTEQGEEAFMRWLQGPAPYGADFQINRYLYRLYRERVDLQAAYPNLDRDGEGFVGWAWAFGVEEMEIPEPFLPPKPAGVRERAVAARPESAVHRQQFPRGPRPDLSVNVIGMLRGTLGLGEAARGYVKALEAVEIPVSTTTVDIEQFVKTGAGPHENYARVDYMDLDGAGASGFKLVCINPDELPSFATSVGAEFFTAAPAIGVWAWETDHIPERWGRAFGLLDEVWVYSSYVAENLRRVAPMPVHRTPPPVLAPDPAGARLELELPEGFRFLFMFDFFSTIQRKNPVGLINAFRRAFEAGDGPQLVIKTINGVHRPAALEEVLWAARGRPDVHVVDRSLSARERDALLAGCDCYVSLHRSEGFGLTLAECMALAKPVIGTAFSGTTDFMTDENSYLVPYDLVRVGADCEIYPAEGTWADPDLAEAARLMRTVVERPDEAMARGEQARRDVERLYSPKTVGAIARSRLESLAELWS